jgi:hypothetical protein
MAGKTPEYKRLILRCRTLWDAYCDNPTKTNLGKVERHLRSMENSSSKRVQNELKKARAAVRRAHKSTARKKTRRRNPRKNPLTVDQALEILGLQPGASVAEVQSAYRTATKSNHPDFGGSAAAMVLVNEARDVLKEQGTGDAVRAKTVRVTKVRSVPRKGARRAKGPAAYGPRVSARAARPARDFRALDDDQVLMTFRMVLERGGDASAIRKEAIGRGLNEELSDIELDVGPRPNPMSRYRPRPNPEDKKYVTVTHPVTGEEVQVEVDEVRQIAPSRGRSERAVFVASLGSEQILEAIERHGSQAKTAQALGISRNRLRKRMQELGLIEGSKKKSSKKKSSKKKSKASGPISDLDESQMLGIARVLSGTRKKASKKKPSPKKPSPKRPVRPPGWLPEFQMAAKWATGWDMWVANTEPPADLDKHTRAGWDAHEDRKFIKVSEEGKIIGFERKAKKRRFYSGQEVIEMANQYAARAFKQQKGELRGSAHRQRLETNPLPARAASQAGVASGRRRWETRTSSRAKG